jgi:hypothetical protein
VTDQFFAQQVMEEEEEMVTSLQPFAYANARTTAHIFIGH